MCNGKIVFAKSMEPLVRPLYAVELGLHTSHLTCVTLVEREFGRNEKELSFYIDCNGCVMISCAIRCTVEQSLHLRVLELVTQGGRKNSGDTKKNFPTKDSENRFALIPICFDSRAYVFIRVIGRW